MKFSGKKLNYKMFFVLAVIVVLFFVLVPLNKVQAQLCCIANDKAGKCFCKDAKKPDECQNWAKNRGYELTRIMESSNCPEACRLINCQIVKEESEEKSEETPQKETPFVPPKLQIPIPGLTFTTEESELKVCTECADPDIIDPADCPKEKCKNWAYRIPWIGEYLAALYKWAVGALAILAVIMIMINGVRWIIAGGSPDKISEAKKGISSAIIGLVLVLLVHQILSLVDPRLTIFKPIVIGVIKRVEENEEKGLPPLPPLPSGDPMNCPDISVDPSLNCSPEQIAAKAQTFLGQNSGPCHCACFVSRVLKASNCGLKTLYRDVPSLEKWLSSNGWIKYDVGKARVTREAQAGDIVAMDGHIGISLGNGRIIDSGIIHEGKTENGCTKTATSCPNVWHGLNYPDGRRYWTESKRCVSNQTIKIRNNFFTRYWRKK
jgi:hypothetical protein